MPGKLFQVGPARTVTGENQPHLVNLFPQFCESTNEPLLALIREKNAHASEKGSTVRNFPMTARFSALRGRGEGRDFGAFEDHAKFFARCTGFGSLIRDHLIAAMAMGYDDADWSSLGAVVAHNAGIRNHEGAKTR